MSSPQNPVVWFEVIGQDGDKLRSFYGELFGWRFQLAPTMNVGVVGRDGDERRGPAGAAGTGGPGGGLRGRVGQAGPGQPTWVAFYTQVPDLAEAIERARGLGSRLLLAPTPIPDATIAVVSDPEGHPVGLCQTRSA